MYKFDSDVTSCVTMCVVVLKGGKEGVLEVASIQSSRTSFLGVLHTAQ